MRNLLKTRGKIFFGITKLVVKSKKFRFVIIINYYKLSSP